MVYVVERYLPGLDACQPLNGLRRLQRSTQQAGDETSLLRSLGSTIVVGDEACCCPFEASSPLAVSDANHRAALRFDWIVSAVTVTPTKGEPR